MLHYITLYHTHTHTHTHIHTRTQRLRNLAKGNVYVMMDVCLRHGHVPILNPEGVGPTWKVCVCVFVCVTQRALGPLEGSWFWV